MYCIHTQERGLLGPTSDSFWRFTGGLHERLDKMIVQRAARVIVFNPGYAEKVRRWNPRTISAPTWFDPPITRPDPDASNPHAVVWVGRLETPKDPELAIRAFAHLALTVTRTSRGRSRSWGPGTLRAGARASRSPPCPPAVASPHHAAGAARARGSRRRLAAGPASS